jgi:hypothetical protein
MAEAKELRRTTSRLRLITAEERRRITVAVVAADPTREAVRPADMVPREATPGTGKNILQAQNAARTWAAFLLCVPFAAKRLGSGSSI